MGYPTRIYNYLDEEIIILLNATKEPIVLNFSSKKEATHQRARFYALKKVIIDGAVSIDKLMQKNAPIPRYLQHDVFQYAEDITNLQITMDENSITVGKFVYTHTVKKRKSVLEEALEKRKLPTSLAEFKEFEQKLDEQLEKAIMDSKLEQEKGISIENLEQAMNLIEQAIKQKETKE